jgi:hypothetical protein
MLQQSNTHLLYLCCIGFDTSFTITHGLIVQFTKLSGGLEGGADPPAFQRAEKRRLEAAKKAEEAAAMDATLGESVCEIENSDVEHNIMSSKKVIILPRT